MEYAKLMEEHRKSPEYKALLENVREMYWKRERLLESEEFRMYDLYGCGERADTEMRLLREHTSEAFWDWLRKRCEYPYDAMTVYRDAVSSVHQRVLSAIDEAVTENKEKDAKMSALCSLENIFKKRREEKNHVEGIGKHSHTVPDEPSCEPVESEQLSSSGGCKQPLESVQS